jgi:hypothetical protein
MKKVNELLIYAVMLLSHGIVHKIHDDADRIKESAKSGTKGFVCVARLPQSYLTEPTKNCGCESLKFLLH